MSISYHGVVGHTSKMTLPSVESWGDNMNILRDPPRSIQTRKKDKVGETSEITQMIQESGNRACEAINVYARGVNPMVSVSYDNNGTNGGQRVNNKQVGNTNSGRQSFLPYRIMDKGAFRPPIRSQTDLFPLSRLPRVWTSSFTQPGFADFSKKARCAGTDENTKGVKNQGQVIRACVKPRVTYQIQTPIVETYEVRNVIQNPIKVKGNSGIKTIGKVTTNVDTPTKEIVTNPLYTDININPNGQIHDIDISHFDTDKYMREPLYSDIDSNKSQNIQNLSIDELYNYDTSRNIQDHLQISRESYKTSYSKQDYIHNDIQLERVTPLYEAYTNKGHNIYNNVIKEPVYEKQYQPNRPVTRARTNIVSNQYQPNDDISNRHIQLRPTINPGSWEQIPSVPTIQREQQITEFDDSKIAMRKQIYEMQQNRNEQLNARNPYS